MSLNNARHVVLGSLTNTPPTPVLPSNTIRCKFSSGYTPTMGDTQTLVDAQENIWDIYKSYNYWNGLFLGNTDLLAVVGANTAGVTNMFSMFYGCTSLTSVSLSSTDRVESMAQMFQGCTSLTSVEHLSSTARVTDMGSMFAGCTSLTSVPLFDTGSSVTDMTHMFNGCTSLTSVPAFSTDRVESMRSMFQDCTNLTSVPAFSTDRVESMERMFAGCINVESGALALYQQASQQTTPPTDYSYCFTACGRNAPSSAPIHTEMQQIPASWGGLGA